jgi:hypothetical protein
MADIVMIIAGDRLCRGFARLPALIRLDHYLTDYIVIQLQQPKSAAQGRNVPLFIVGDKNYVVLLDTSVS